MGLDMSIGLLRKGGEVFCREWAFGPDDQGSLLGQQFVFKHRSTLLVRPVTPHFHFATG
jgi:hypothetical protein